MLKCSIQLSSVVNTLCSSKLTTFQMAEAAGFSKRAITSIRYNLRLSGSVKALSIEARRPRSITPIRLEALCDYQLEKPDLYLYKTGLSSLDEFDIYHEVHN